MITKINSSQINEKSITGEHLADNLNLNNIILSGSIKNKADSPDSTITVGTSINAITTGDIKIDGTKIGIGGDANAAYKVTLKGNTFIDGDLNISGSLNYTQSEIVQITDNTLMLNSNWTGTPTENASIEVKRGTLSNTAIRWNESSDVWELTNDGTNYYRIIDQNYGDTRYINSDGDTMSGDLTISGTSKLQFDANNYIQNNSGLQIVGASGYIKSGSTEMAKWTSTDFYVSRNLYVKGNSGSSSALIANAASAPTALTASSDDMHVMLTRHMYVHSNSTADASFRLYGKNDTKYLDITTNTTDTNVILNTDTNGYKLRVSGTDKFTLNNSGNAVFYGTIEAQGTNISVNNVGGFVSIGTASSTSNYISFNGTNIGQLKYTSASKLFELTDGGTGYRDAKASTIEATTEFKTSGQFTAISSANSSHKLFIGARNDYITDTNSAAIFITDGGTGGLSNSEGAHLYIQGRKQNDRHIMFSTGASSSERMRITGTGEIGIGTSTPSEKLEVNGNVKASRFISTVSTGTAPFAVNSTTAVTNLNSDMIDGLHATDIVQISGTQTITGNKTFSAKVYAKNIFVNADGEPITNLGEPTIQEMALFEEEFNNKLAFYDISKLTFSYTMDGTNWIDCTNSISDTDKKKLVGGHNGASITIPNGAQKYRIDIRNDENYVYLNALYAYISTNSHSVKVHIWKKRDDGDWIQHTSSNTSVSSWPGHLYLPFPQIAWSTSSTPLHYHDIRIEFIPTWSNDPTYGSYPIGLSRLQIWGGYPAGKRTIYSVDENKNTVFPATITATQIISNVATGTKPISVTSTTKCDNLNADMIDGYHVDSSNTANTIPVRDSYGKITANITGNADTATKLLTARKINNVSFDGTTDININLNNSLSMSTTSDIASVSGASFNGSSAIAWTTFKPDQNINTSSTPQFARLGIGTAADSTYKLKISDGTIATGVTDNSSAIGFTFNTPSYSTSGAKIVSFKNNGAEKAYIDKDGSMAAYTYISTVSTGTAPFTVSSTTVVTNLNTDLLDGKHASDFALSNHTHSDYPTLEAIGKDNITTRTQSGFYQTSSATTANGWPETTNSWYHLLTSTHSNTTNYYSMQFAASFYDSSKLFFRVTNGNGSSTWNKVWHSGNDGSGSGLDADLLDGKHASDFSLATHTHDFDKYEYWTATINGSNPMDLTTKATLNFKAGTNIALAKGTGNEIEIKAVDNKLTSVSGSGNGTVTFTITNTLDSTTSTVTWNASHSHANDHAPGSDNQNVFTKLHALNSSGTDVTNSPYTVQNQSDAIKLKAGNNITLSMSGNVITIDAIDTNTATAADDILDGSNTGTQVKYSPYTTQQNKLSFDTSTTNPTRTDRLNLNGYLYATKVYNGSGNEYYGPNNKPTPADIGAAASSHTHSEYVLKAGDTMTGKLTINSGDSSNGAIETSDANKWITKIYNINAGMYWDTTNDNIEIRNYNGKVRLIGGSSGTAGIAVEVDNTGKVTANVLKSTVATGTAPLEVTSSTAVTNLNADMVDGKHASDFVLTNSCSSQQTITSSYWDNTNGGVIKLSSSNSVGAGLTLYPSASALTNKGWHIYAGAGSSAVGDGNIGFLAVGETKPVRLVIKRDGTMLAGQLDSTDINNNVGKVWTSSNHGENSGLNADLLDGKHASSFIELSNIYCAKITFGAGKYEYVLNHNKGWSNYAIMIASSTPEAHVYYTDQTNNSVKICLDDPAYEQIDVYVTLINTTINSFTA